MASLPVVGKAHEAAAGTAPFHWFIYGSSLDGEAFIAWAAQHGYRVPDFTKAFAARLDGFRLSFDVNSNFWGGTVASVVEEAGAHVEGLALPLPAEARGLVDHKEGAISGLFTPFTASVTPLAGGEPVKALVYRAAPAKRLPSEGKPAARFVATLVKGARASHLSPAWIAKLEALA